MSYDTVKTQKFKSPNDAKFREIQKKLVKKWVNDYYQSNPEGELVEVNESGNSYLFDVTQGRLVAAWGVSHGKNNHARDKSRMQQHPKGGGDDVHRGHAIPHSMGGGLDINLVPQLGSLNVGEFRTLEREAVSTPGSLYFTHWKYGNGSQRPTSVDQGLVAPGTLPKINEFSNIKAG
jgi:hypothetical protein